MGYLPLPIVHSMQMWDCYWLITVSVADGVIVRLSWQHLKASGPSPSGSLCQQNFWPCSFLSSSALALRSTGVGLKNPCLWTWSLFLCVLDSALQQWSSALDISGGHINPAVTVAMVCTRKISLAKSVFYIVAQCLGAIAGAGILYLVTPSSVIGGFGVTQIHAELSSGHGLLVELIITFQLVFTIFASCDSKRNDVTGSVALGIGLSVAIGHLFAISYTGAMNPARSFGPAVIMGNWKDHWVYWLGPIIGATLAAALYQYVYCPDDDLKFKENKTTQQSKGKYIEVEDPKSQRETDDLLQKPGIIHFIDLERGDDKKGRDPTNEVLSSV
ncbi:aquaporin-4 [Thamnophis elegans]|uniref:aquaporin-4 n=1 Tax=Thamnophis elegans TaxID=35005 RepID=UPI001376782A|nr:aquaporin-4 [Thamnophis elegans]